MHDVDHSHTSFNKSLSVLDLTAFGIAAVVGAGIFSTIGNAAFNGGPGVILLFIFTAVACGLSAFCYAEFASRVPVAGSAYTYAYVSMGELLAWIIGWDLIMEYAIGNIAVAISWSDYFTSLLSGFGITFPKNLSMDWLTAKRAFDAVETVLAQGVSASDVINHGISLAQLDLHQMYLQAPTVFNIPIVCDLPAFLITVVVTWIVFIGIKESKNISNFMVLLKLLVLAVIIFTGAFFIDYKNWSPFMPHGMSGVLKGVSGVFFAYIGFDAISTTAEECKNPQRDLPKAMIFSLLICTLLYVLVALVLTGIVSYEKLSVGDPLAYVFGPEGANVPWLSGVIAISAVIALFSVLLVYQMGQPRIWMAMSRDGLLPKIFSSMHPKYKTPWFSTLMTGVAVGIPALFMNLTEVTDLTSIGTLFAFLLVAIGVLQFEKNTNLSHKYFKMPFVSSKYLFPFLSLCSLLAIYFFSADSILELKSAVFGQSFEVFKHKIPLLIYLVGMLWLNVKCFKKNLSLIPVLAIATTGYLMTELGWINWVRFGVWLVIGLVIYFFYGIKKSALAKSKR